jgi:hypothetical protein
MSDTGTTAVDLGEGDCVTEQASGVIQTVGTQFRDGLSELLAVVSVSTIRRTRSLIA